MLEVTDEQVAVAVERHAQAEPTGRPQLLQRAPVGREPVDLAPLATAPDAAVAVNRDSFRVVELRVGQHAVERHANIGGRHQLAGALLCD
ncbi:MAG TPA: hypothetical protein VIV12_05930, partial [Streptosporangiaceae bacterium]